MKSKIAYYFFFLFILFTGLNILPVFGQECGDVNCDGEVNVVDALLIAQYYSGLIDGLNCCNTGVTLSGYVTSGTDDKPVAGAELYMAGQGTTSNGNGYFSLHVDAPREYDYLEVRARGYAPY